MTRKLFDRAVTAFCVLFSALCLYGAAHDPWAFAQVAPIGPGGGGGLSGFSSDGTGITGSGKTVTSSDPVLSLTQTWNAGATVFTGSSLNVTATASAALSNLLDLQTAGSSAFTVGYISANGANPALWLNAGGSQSATNYTLFKNGTAVIVNAPSGGQIVLGLNDDQSTNAFAIKAGVSAQLNSAGVLGFTATTATAALDTALSRDSAGVVDVGTGAQGSAAGSVKLANLTASGQIFSTAGLPTIGSGACGTTSNGAVVAGSTNQAMNITIGAAATTTCTIGFSATLANAPKGCSLTPTNAAAAATGTTVARISSISTSQVVITGSALANANYYLMCL